MLKVETVKIQTLTNYTHSIQQIFIDDKNRLRVHNNFNITKKIAPGKIYGKQRRHANFLQRI